MERRGGPHGGPVRVRIHVNYRSGEGGGRRGSGV